MIACTIIARNYLSHARVLARSYLEHHPRDEFFVLAVDGLPPGDDPGTGVRLIDAASLDCPYFRELCFKYEVIELCTALKPTLLRFLFEKVGAESVIYLDPDILILRPLAEVPGALEGASLLLTPHLVKPLPLDGQKPSEMDLLACGAYNLGFLGLRNCEESRSFLDWWEERLREGCLMDRGGRHFVDQKWVDYAPSFFPSTAILRDDTYNVAMWNLHSRRIERVDGRFLVNGRPMAFFHFSGFGVEGWDPRFQSAPRASIEDGSPLADLLSRYGRLQEENGYAVCRKWSYGYSRFSNGKPIGRALRRLYLSLGETDRAQFPDPFLAEGTDSFYEWALTPNPELANLSPFLLSLYRLRPDVMAAFPDVMGTHRDSFLEWARTSGSQEMEFDPRMVRIENSPLSVDENDAGGASLEITKVLQTPLSSKDLLGQWFDLPKPGQTVDADALAITGWVLGRHDPVESVEIVSAGRVISRAPVNVGRPEVAAANPSVLFAARCGFRAVLAVEEGDDTELHVQAVLPDHRRVAIGVIRARSRRGSAT